MMLCENSGIALEGAKIINESKNYFNVLYTSYVLTNSDAIEVGVAICYAKLFNEISDEKLLKDIYNTLCDSKFTVDFDTALNLVLSGKQSDTTDVLLKELQEEENDDIDVNSYSKKVLKKVKNN